MKQIIIPPKDGWKENVVYHVEAAFSECNPIWGYLFFSGYLTGPCKTPGGYNEIYGTDNHATIDDVVYMRVLHIVMDEGYVESCPNKNVLVTDL